MRFYAVVSGKTMTTGEPRLLDRLRGGSDCCQGFRQCRVPIFGIAGIILVFLDFLRMFVTVKKDNRQTSSMTFSDIALAGSATLCLLLACVNEKRGLCRTFMLPVGIWVSFLPLVGFKIGMYMSYPFLLAWTLTVIYVGTTIVSAGLNYERQPDLAVSVNRELYICQTIALVFRSVGLCFVTLKLATIEEVNWRPKNKYQNAIEMTTLALLGTASVCLMMPACHCCLRPLVKVIPFFAIILTLMVVAILSLPGQMNTFYVIASTIFIWFLSLVAASFNSVFPEGRQEENFMLVSFNMHANVQCPPPGPGLQPSAPPAEDPQPSAPPAEEVVTDFNPPKGRVPPRYSEIVPGGAGGSEDAMSDISDS